MAEVPLGPTLRAKIEAQTEKFILDEATRVNRAAAHDESAPTAEVLTEVFDTPDEVWPVARVRTVIMSLYKDYVRALLPHLNLETREIAADAPSDDDIRARLVASSTTYATLARANQHATWFKFFTDRTRTDADRATVYDMMELRVAVENGRLSEAEATARLSRSRAGVLAKARALERMDELKAADAVPSRKKIREVREAVETLKKLDEPKRHGGSGGSGGSGRRVKTIPPALLAKLRADAAGTDGKDK